MQLLYKSIWIVGLFAVLSPGCKKFVQVDAPPTQLVTSTVFDNSATATSALTGIYAQMANNGESYWMALNNGLLADEFMNYSTNNQNIQLYTDEMTAAISPNSRWSEIYNYIYQANAVIEGLQNNNNIDLAIQHQLTGEALFLRAFWLFYLTNMYGAIPLVTTTSYTTNATLLRSSQTAVYRQVIADLSQAQNMLNSNYVDGSDTTITTERTRPTKWAADALLSRVYLYTQKYDSAEIEATAVINNANLYSLCPNLNNVFLANSTEAIWQLQVPLPNSNVATPDGQYFILISAPSTGTYNSTTISAELLNTFEANDLRRTNWIDSFSSGGDTFYFPYKYKVYDTSAGSGPEYVMVLRLAEQFLIRAEAEAQLGNMADAANDLNTIRSRADLGASPTLTVSSSLQQADSAILHERQVELFTEWGHRWFDLVRMDSANIVMGSPGNVCQQKGGAWTSNSQLYPIPQSEITADPNLTQNLGYSN